MSLARLLLLFDRNRRAVRLVASYLDSRPRPHDCMRSTVGGNQRKGCPGSSCGCAPPTVPYQPICQKQGFQDRLPPL